MKHAASALDPFFLTRPTLFYPVWTFFLAGLAGGSRIGRGTVAFANPLPPWAAAAALTLLMGSVFILNQLQDMETDRVNGKLFLLSGGVVSPRFAAVEAALLAAAGLGVAFWTDLLLGLAFSTLFVLAGLLYNYPPAAWKNRPFGSMAVNGLGGMLIFDIGWMCGGGDQRLPLQALAYGLGGVAVFLNTTLPDMKGDAKTGKVTFGVRYGLGRTAVWALVFEAAAAALAFWLREWLLAVPSAAVLPLFAVAAVRRTLSDTLRATKASVTALALALCVVQPLFPIPVAAVFFLSRWYYRRRFGFDYPNFRVS